MSRIAMLFAFSIALAPVTTLCQEDDDPFEGWDRSKSTGEEKAREPAGAGEQKAQRPTEQPQAEKAQPAPEIVYPTSYPVREVDRPLALPEMVLEPRLQMLVDFLPGDNFFSMQVGAGMGIANGVEAGLALALSMAPSVYAGVNAWGLYEFPSLFSGALKWAARARILSAFTKNYLPFYGSTSLTVVADAPAKWKAMDLLAVTSALGLGASINADRPDFFVVYWDVGALIQPIDPLVLSWKLELWGMVGDNSDVILPMKIGAQYTLVGDLDVFVQFGFMDLTEGADWLQLLFGACYRIGL